MPMIETYRKQAKLLVRWHREGNYSVGGKLRMLDRFQDVTDREALDMALPLTLAQEIVAVEAGFADWAALKAGAGNAAGPSPEKAPVLAAAVPILFVRDVTAAAAFYSEKLGFAIDFLHGKPAFYGSVSRDAACLHLRFVGQPNFTELAAREGSLILATIETGNVKALFEEYKAAGVEFAQGLVKQAWGGTDFHVRDPDGNVIAFVQYRRV
ncbi:VOC family protein [Sphingomonas sp. JC676]|uniref:glyoxalase superfamily protein n=1 Tax=Sphingomonas sp. JC676 TaxID=2768065 RepID=UPI001657782C|nr:glyoxalase superfamily protein [Sphingomonas sp. JC676]MBC9031290.1 VOC family protein [Sphingomonas sp. JC676]